MKVWVVFENVPYEGREVVGIFESSELAESWTEGRAKRDYAERHKLWYDIEEWEVVSKNT